MCPALTGHGRLDLGCVSSIQENAPEIALEMQADRHTIVLHCSTLSLKELADLAGITLRICHDEEVHLDPCMMQFFAALPQHAANTLWSAAVSYVVLYASGGTLYIRVFDSQKDNHKEL